MVSSLQSGFSIIKCQGKKVGVSQLPNACSTAEDPARCCCSENKKGHKTGMAISKYPRGTLLTPALRGSRCFPTDTLQLVALAGFPLGMFSKGWCQSWASLGCP